MHLTLAKLLGAGLPQHRKLNGEINRTRVAMTIEVSKQTVSRWLIENRLPVNRVNQILNLPGSSLSREDLLKFVNFG